MCDTDVKVKFETSCREFQPSAGDRAEDFVLSHGDNIFDEDKKQAKEEKLHINIITKEGEEYPFSAVKNVFRKKNKKIIKQLCKKKKEKTIIAEGLTQQIKSSKKEIFAINNSLLSEKLSTEEEIKFKKEINRLNLLLENTSIILKCIK